MAFKPIHTISRDPASCAIFGAISFGGAKLSGNLALAAISQVECARCGDGSGILFGNAQRFKRGKIISVLAREPCFVEDIRRILCTNGIQLSEFVPAGKGPIYEANTQAEYLPLVSAVVAANAAVAGDDAHVISFGHGLRLFKGLGQIRNLENHYGISAMSAPALIAHGRYATGASPRERRAHPFSFGNVGIVHNGDVTSFHANLAACTAKLAELYHTQGGKDLSAFLANLQKNWVGTDSEIIGAMIYTLLKIGILSEPGLSIPSIMDAIVPPFDNRLTRLLRGSTERARLDSLASRYNGFALDGPVSAVSLITYEDEVQLLALRDRNNFRPLQIVIDHENGIAYVASELCQIIAASGLDIASQSVESFSPEPGRYLWVSSKSGILASGRNHRPFIAFAKTGGITRLTGTANQFAGDQINDRVEYCGILGTFGASHTNGKGTFIHHGCLGDNCFEASSLERVVVYGNASQMLANAYAGTEFFIRGSADCRAFMQLRPKDGRKPVAIIGESAGQYLGKMASGGIIVALGLQHLGKEDVDTPIVDDFVGTGMVADAKIFVRSYLIDDHIGRPPSRRGVIAVCKCLMDQGIITDSQLHDIRHDALNFPRLKEIIKNPQAISRLEHLFVGMPVVERRGLNDEERAELVPHLEQFFRDFGLSPEWLELVLKSGYTIISVAKKQAVLSK